MQDYRTTDQFIAAAAQCRRPERNISIVSPIRRLMQTNGTRRSRKTPRPMIACNNEARSVRKQLRHRVGKAGLRLATLLDRPNRYARSLRRRFLGRSGEPASALPSRLAVYVDQAWQISSPHPAWRARHRQIRYAKVAYTLLDLKNSDRAICMPAPLRPLPVDLTRRRIVPSAQRLPGTTSLCAIGSLKWPLAWNRARALI